MSFIQRFHCRVKLTSEIRTASLQGTTECGLYVLCMYLLFDIEALTRLLHDQGALHWTTAILIIGGGAMWVVGVVSGWGMRGGRVSSRRSRRG